jgi:hypothetical protein
MGLCVRAVEAFEENLDLAGLGSAEVVSEATGRPLYRPATQFKISPCDHLIGSTYGGSNLEIEAGNSQSEAGQLRLWIDFFSVDEAIGSELQVQSPPSRMDAPQPWYGRITAFRPSPPIRSGWGAPFPAIAEAHRYRRHPSIPRYLGSFGQPVPWSGLESGRPSKLCKADVIGRHPDRTSASPLQRSTVAFSVVG